MLFAATIWAWSFSKARTNAFQDFYRLYPDRIKYYEKEYQYIRYLWFRHHVARSSYAERVNDALGHLSNQIETDSNSPVSSHPFISVSIGTLLAIIGGAAGQWNAKVVTLMVLSLVLVVYFAYMVIGITRAPLADLKEFKRFLLWMKEDLA